jgi:hypothetical protein
VQFSGLSFNLSAMGPVASPLNQPGFTQNLADLNLGKRRFRGSWLKTTRHGSRKTLHGEKRHVMAPAGSPIDKDSDFANNCVEQIGTTDN